MNPSADLSATDRGMIALVYELLDAHSDTLELAAGAVGGLIWAVHLDYLRALQRTSREMLAQLEAA